MNNFQKLIHIIPDSERRGIYRLGFMMAVVTALEIIIVSLLYLILNHFSDPKALNNNYFYNSIIDFKSFVNLDTSSLLISIFTSFFLIKTLAVIYLSYLEGKIINDIRATLSFNFLKGYMSMPRMYHLRNNTSDLIKNLTNEIESILININSMTTLFIEGLILIGMLALMIILSPKITLILFLLLTLYSLFILLINRKTFQKISKRRPVLVQQRIKAMVEGLTGAKAFELSNRGDMITREFKSPNKEYSKIATTASFRNSLSKPLFELFVFLVVSIGFLYLYNNTLNLNEYLPLFIVFIAAAYRIVPSFAKIIFQIQKFNYNQQSINRLFLDNKLFIENQISDLKNAKDTKDYSFKKQINITNVSFTYDSETSKGNNLILDNINLSIEKNSKVGILGISGSGKSTFIDILTGILKPQKGLIDVDGTDIRFIKKNWQRSIGCVPQDVFILDNTIKKNIAFGIPEEEINQEKLNTAISNSRLDNMINELDNGINTIIGEGGSRVSGGQKQRIGIARALYNNPDIIVLDEATNALDELTEKQIVEEILSKKLKKTVILVTHNKNNLKYCDKVYEITDRSIKEKHLNDKNVHKN